MLKMHLNSYLTRISDSETIRRMQQSSWNILVHIMCYFTILVPHFFFEMCKSKYSMLCVLGNFVPVVPSIHMNMATGSYALWLFLFTLHKILHYVEAGCPFQNPFWFSKVVASFLILNLFLMHHRHMKIKKLLFVKLA